MKTPEELNALKEEVETLNKKLAELTDEELKQVAGGIAPGRPYWTGRHSQSKDKGLSDDELNSAG